MFRNKSNLIEKIEKPKSFNEIIRYTIEQINKN